jgi:hypothetical protein
MRNSCIKAIKEKPVHKIKWVGETEERALMLQAPWREGLQVELAEESTASWRGGLHGELLWREKSAVESLSEERGAPWRKSLRGEQVFAERISPRKEECHKWDLASCN